MWAQAPGITCSQLANVDGLQGFAELEALLTLMFYLRGSSQLASANRMWGLARLPALNYSGPRSDADETQRLLAARARGRAAVHRQTGGGKRLYYY